MQTIDDVFRLLGVTVWSRKVSRGLRPLDDCVGVCGLVTTKKDRPIRLFYPVPRPPTNRRVSKKSNRDWKVPKSRTTSEGGEIIRKFREIVQQSAYLYC